MDDWPGAGKLLRLCPVDFASDVLTCGVLDPKETGFCIMALGDLDGG